MFPRNLFSRKTILTIVSMVVQGKDKKTKREN